MDTSEQYIKMCKKAWEIQESWNSHRYDYYDVPNLGIRCGNNPTSNSVWLPRQDQLQKMVTTVNPRATHSQFVLWVQEDVYGKKPYDDILVTLEQLWLAFVMHEKYNKVWNNRTWIEQ